MYTIEYQHINHMEDIMLLLTTENDALNELRAANAAVVEASDVLDADPGSNAMEDALEHQQIAIDKFFAQLRRWDVEAQAPAEVVL